MQDVKTYDSPAAKDLMRQLGLVIAGHDPEDALNALANLMLTTLIQAVDTIEEAEEFLGRAHVTLKAGVTVNWTPVRDAMSRAVATTGRA